MQLVIVRRGQFSTFKMLSDQFADDPEVRVIWDRRQGTDRRHQARPTPAERRREERRRPPNTSWTLLGYMVVNAPDDVRPSA